MKLIIPLEFKSTGAAEISLFHKLSSGNARKPFKLAPAPGVIPLQLAACVDPPTCSVTLAELLAPGSGFCTVTGVAPAVLAVPVAVSCVLELKVVCSAAPARNTCAPFTNLL